jgi:outer membrane receptor protein involved in Fe transport
VRGENYSDFGSIATGKLSARADLARWFALRGTVSTGFRAPSLQQQYFTSTASVLTTTGTRRSPPSWKRAPSLDQRCCQVAGRREAAA